MQVYDDGGGEMKTLNANDLAILFHETYERLAPQYGYETRRETRAFDLESPNGKLMVAVCREIIDHCALMAAAKTDQQQVAPERKHVVAIKIGADSWDDVIAALNHILFVAESEGAGRDITSGGGSFGFVFVDKTNPQVTHDSYFDEVDRWIEENRARKARENKR